MITQQDAVALQSNPSLCCPYQSTFGLICRDYYIGTSSRNESQALISIWKHQQKVAKGVAVALSGTSFILWFEAWLGDSTGCVCIGHGSDMTTLWSQLVQPSLHRSSKLEHLYFPFSHNSFILSRQDRSMQIGRWHIISLLCYSHLTNIDHLKRSDIPTRMAKMLFTMSYRVWIGDDDFPSAVFGAWFHRPKSPVDSLNLSMLCRPHLQCFAVLSNYSNGRLLEINSRPYQYCWRITTPVQYRNDESCFAYMPLHALQKSSEYRSLGQSIWGMFQESCCNVAFCSMIRSKHTDWDL